MQQQKGLTLIEALVIIAGVIVVLSLFTLALFGARKEARDVKRVSDIQALRSSLAAIKVQFGSFVESGCQAGSVADCRGGNLERVMPTIQNFIDPRGRELCANNCTAACQYAFVSEIMENDYEVLFYLEKGIGQFPDAGCYSLTPAGIEKQ